MLGAAKENLPYKQINDDSSSSLNINSQESLLIQKSSLVHPSENNENQESKQQIKKSSMRRLMLYTLKHKALLLFANIGLFITSVSLVALPYLCGQIIDAISKNQNTDKNESLNKYCWQFVFVVFLAAVFGFIRGCFYNLIGERVVIELRNELFEKLLNKDIEFYDQNRSGELISRLTSDISLVQSAASDNISILLRNMVQFFGSLVLLFLLTWQLTLILLAIVPPFVVLVMIFVHFYKEYTKQYQDLIAKSTQIATEALGNMRIVRSFSSEQEESRQFNSATNSTYIVGKKRAILYGVFNFFGTIFGYGVILLVLWYGGRLVEQGNLSIGSLSSFVMYTLTLTVSLISVSGVVNTLVQASTVSEKIFELMDHEVKIKNGNLIVNNNAGAINFENVTFSYPSKTDVNVLSNINLAIQAGDVIAFVGQSGSGKSTIVSLIERFYDVTGGTIMIDGQRIQDFNIRALHQAIGFVSQEPTLFSGTLEQNIAYGVQNYTEDELNNAMKMAHAYEFVTNKQQFPEGLKTVVGERGVKLSGGQKQRIAIARALIKNPKILIFDEATSALDSESEYQVQQAIDELVRSGRKTIIIIAHRLSTVINCKSIAVLQNGIIKEYGTHSQLLQMNGVYRQLIDRQLSSNDSKVIIKDEL